jgi:hypothetical protein
MLKYRIDHFLIHKMFKSFVYVHQKHVSRMAVTHL